MYPNGIGPNMYALLRGTGRGFALEDSELQDVLGALRLQSCTGASIDSFAYDFFGGLFYRFAQYGETDEQWISRIQSIFSIPKCTQPGMQAILNVFWPWILQQFGAQNLAFDVIGGVDTAGAADVVVQGQSVGGITPTGQTLGVDTYGGVDTGKQFIDASGPAITPPTPYAFDAQSDPALSMLITPHIAPPNFGIYIRYQNFSDTLIRPILSPSDILSQLVAAYKPLGTVPVFATNRS